MRRDEGIHENLSVLEIRRGFVRKSGESDGRRSTDLQALQQITGEADLGVELLSFGSSSAQASTCERNDQLQQAKLK